MAKGKPMKTKIVVFVSAVLVSFVFAALAHAGDDAAPATTSGTVAYTATGNGNVIDREIEQIRIEDIIHLHRHRNALMEQKARVERDLEKTQMEIERHTDIEHKDVSEAKQEESESKKDRAEAKKEISESKKEASESKREASKAKVETSGSGKEASKAKVEASESRKDASKARVEASESRRDASKARAEELRAKREADDVERLHKHEEALRMKLGEIQRRLTTVEERIAALETAK
jgi:outer membrane biosynthesis protein TonB